jgi:hypothetical protein
MNMVDDATGTTSYRMGEQETIWTAVGVLRGWIGKYGVLRAWYTVGTIYISDGLGNASACVGRRPRRSLQLQPQKKRYGPQAKALVCEWEDAAVEVRYRGERIDYEDLVSGSTGRSKQAAPRTSQEGRK